MITFSEVFDITTPLSKTWQNENMELAAAHSMAQETLEIISDKRTTDYHIKTV